MIKTVPTPRPKKQLGVKRVPSIGFKMILILLVISALYQDLFNRGMIRTGALYYFTFQSNILAAMCLILSIFPTQDNKFQRVFRGLCLLAITMTGIIYNFVLYKIWLDWNTVGYAYSSTVLHVVMPIGFILDWLLFDKHKRMKWRDLWIWLSYPFIYAICSIYMSLRKGTSLYFFFNIHNGLNIMFKWVTLLIIALLLIGSLFIALDQHIEQKKSHKLSITNQTGDSHD